MGQNILNLQAGQAGVDKIKKSIQLLMIQCQTANSNPFGALTQADPDLGSGFISQLNGSLADIYTFLNTHILPAAENYFKDNTGNVPKPTVPGGGQGGAVPGGGVPGGGKGKAKKPKTDPPSDPPTEPPIDLDPKDVKKMDGYLQGMTLVGLDSTIDSLVALADQKKQCLDQMVEADDNADDIKQILLDSPYIPQEFKDMIKDMDSKLVRKYVEAMLKGQSPDVFELNPLNLGIVYSYLSKFAAQNGISVEALLNNSKNSELLKTALGNFDNVVDLIKGWEEKPSQDVQKDLLKLYNGDEVADVPQENLDVVKSFVDYISEETDIHYEDLLNDTTYADTLKDAAVQFGKTAVFFSATAHFTTAGMMENASQMFNGTNYKAYGMTKSEVKSFKKEMEKLAKEKNTTTDELLTESKYADDVKEALKKSKSAEGVGSIFKNAKSKVSQNVARNLYNINVSSKITPVTEDNPLVED